MMKEKERQDDYSVQRISNVAFKANEAKLNWIKKQITERYILTVLEFGVGYSTQAIAEGLRQNKIKYLKVLKEIGCREENSYEVHSIDTMKKWINVCRKRIKGGELEKYIHFHRSNARLTVINENICSLYNKLPNIYPDFIYIDGPDQYSVKGCINGINTRKISRVPMAGDVIRMEFFLPPICTIAIDGRYHNTIFLRKNLKRDWKYLYEKEVDQHLLILNEECPGKISRKLSKYYQQCKLINREEHQDRDLLTLG